MKKILQKESPVLRKVGESIPIGEITSPKIQKIIKEMRVALASQDDGVAIAAPQIGESLRIFVVSGRLFKIEKKIAAGNDIDEPKKEGRDETMYKDLVFINPIIEKVSRKKVLVEEGCLSIRWLYGKVKRAEKVSISAYDETVRKVRRGASGLMAQVFQHEVDHLNGILFTDKASEVREIKPEKKNE